MGYKAENIHYLVLYRRSMPSHGIPLWLGAWSLESHCLQLCDLEQVTQHLYVSVSSCVKMRIT